MAILRENFPRIFTSKSFKLDRQMKAFFFKKICIKEADKSEGIWKILQTGSFDSNLG